MKIALLGRLLNRPSGRTNHISMELHMNRPSQNHNSLIIKHSLQFKLIVLPANFSSPERMI